MTHNERVQAYLAEGLKAARAANMHKLLEDGYCAAYLAQKLASKEEASVEKFSAVERERLSAWMHFSADCVLDVIGDVTTGKLAELAAKGEFALGEYLMTKFTEAMIDDLESRDVEPWHLADDDMRERLRDYKVEEIGVW